MFYQFSFDVVGSIEIVKFFTMTLYCFKILLMFSLDEKYVNNMLAQVITTMLYYLIFIIIKKIVYSYINTILRKLHNLCILKIKFSFYSEPKKKKIPIQLLIYSYFELCLNHYYVYQIFFYLINIIIYIDIYQLLNYLFYSIMFNHQMKMEKNKSNGTENQSQESNGLTDLKNENEVTYCLELFY